MRIQTYFRIFLQVARTQGFCVAVRKSISKLTGKRFVQTRSLIQTAGNHRRVDLPETFPPISVIVPTYNRSCLLAKSIKLCLENSGGVELEFIVIDDGSTDDTQCVLESLTSSCPMLRYLKIENSGPGNARNLGAALAAHDIILFLGDDIQPVNDNFFRVHSQLHAANPHEGFAVLGKVVWPNGKDESVNAVMRHIQGKGGEQFAYSGLTPYSAVDFRHFYTANVSLKKSVVQDWHKDGFSAAFDAAAFEDIELAYRLQTELKGFQLFYAPASVGVHRHQYEIGGFMNRQISAGRMAQVFYRLHPEAAVVLAVSDVVKALRSHSKGTEATDFADYLSVMEGIQSWARLIERRQNLGSRTWHEDFMTAVFRLCYRSGFVEAYTDPRANFPKAYELIFQQFLGDIDWLNYSELAGWMVRRQGLLEK